MLKIGKNKKSKSKDPAKLQENGNSGDVRDAAATPSKASPVNAAKAAPVNAAGAAAEAAPVNAPETQADDGQAERERLVRENMERRKKRKQEREGKMNPVLKAAIIAAAVVGGIIFSFSSFFTIDRIDVEGNSYFTEDEIISIGHIEPGHNLIYSPGKMQIINYLENNPHIADAKVYRRLPSTLLVKVRERRQIAAIAFADDYIIIDKDGFVISKTNTEPQITVVRGVKIKEMEVGKKVVPEDEQSLKDAINLILAMQKGKLYFKAIDVSGVFVKANIYDSLVCTGSKKEFIRSMNEGHLQKVLEELFSRNIKRGTIALNDDGYASFSPGVN